MPIIIEEESGGVLIELAEFRPPARHDGNAWSGFKVEQADDPVGSWAVLATGEFEASGLDEDPTKPALRSVSATTSKEWLRLTFTRGTESSVPSAFINATGLPYLPTLSEVSTLLRARTAELAAQSDLEEPGELGNKAGVFNENTNPTAADVTQHFIPDASRDVALALGTVPGEFIEDARRVCSLRVAAEIEQSKIPEQAEATGTIYQTLRLTYSEKLTAIEKSLQWWVLARNLERSGSVVYPLVYWT